RQKVNLKIEPDGRMFPVTDSSQTIIDAIWQEMMRQKVQVHYHKTVSKIERADNAFLIHFADEHTYTADRVLITCGGFAKEEQYHRIKNLGHTINSPVPSLFTFNIPNHPVTELMGVSVPDAIVKVMGTKIAEQGPV